jgi:sugar (pentulose or hexulose) kinase
MCNYLGIEFGSTRIKAVLIDDNYKPVASGSHDWENKLADGIWTYDLDDVWKGLQDAVARLKDDVKAKTGKPLGKIDAVGLSAMMHGYLAFDKGGRLLAPFRTWRNTITGKAAAELTALFGFNIPQRWSIAHLYQAVLNGESHVKDIAFLTTLAGYVHWKLTGKKVLGVGDASGVFPIDSAAMNYDEGMAKKFDSLIAGKYGWKLLDIIPAVLNAGEDAGSLTAEGAKLLDPSGEIGEGVPFCPPEGDAGTGMVATNSVAPRTGNVSAGTSIFAMIVMEKALSAVHPEIDIATTPAGRPVAMVHCNNCTTDLDAWVKLFGEAIALSGSKIEKAALYDALYYRALEGDADCGGLVSYNFYAGEHTVNIEEGRPLFARLPDARFTLANFMRNLLYATMATLKIGMNILIEKEKVRVDKLLGHGGLFKTPGVGQRFMAAVLNAPVAVMESAGEGGAWGIALLAAFMSHKGTKAQSTKAQSLEEFLETKVFAGNKGTSVAPDAKDAAGFAAFMKRYEKGLAVEKAAVENI